MDLSVNAIVHIATQMEQTRVAQEAQLLMVKKSNEVGAAAVAGLLQALPDPAPLAVQGNVGTLVNTFA